MTFPRRASISPSLWRVAIDRLHDFEQAMFHVVEHLMRRRAAGHPPLGDERPSAKRSLDPNLKSLRQVRRVFPVDAIVLPDIEMQILDLILSTSPNNLPC